MKNFKSVVLVTTLVGVSALSPVMAQDLAAIEGAFAEAGTSAAQVVGYVAAALITFVASLWILKGIRSGR